MMRKRDEENRDDEGREPRQSEQEGAAALRHGPSSSMSAFPES